jgi:hypothetical protein
MHALRAIGAILRAAASLDAEQGADLDGGRIEVPTMQALGGEDQIGKRPVEKRADFLG